MDTDLAARWVSSRTVRFDILEGWADEGAPLRENGFVPRNLKPQSFRLGCLNKNLELFELKPSFSLCFDRQRRLVFIGSDCRLELDVELRGYECIEDMMGSFTIHTGLSIYPVCSIRQRRTSVSASRGVKTQRS
jgi:hypothetical protein